MRSVSGGIWLFFFDCPLVLCVFDEAPVQFAQVMVGGAQLPCAPATLQTTHAEAIRALAIPRLSKDGLRRSAALAVNRLIERKRPNLPIGLPGFVPGWFFVVLALLRRGERDGGACC